MTDAEFHAKAKALADAGDAFAARVLELLAERDAARALALSAAERCWRQSAILDRRAERPVEPEGAD